MLFGFSTVSVDITHFNGIDLEHKSIPIVDGLDAIYKAVIAHPSIITPKTQDMGILTSKAGQI